MRLRLVEHFQKKVNRFVSSLMVENSFNKLKYSVAKDSTNTSCTPQHAMAVPIDKGVLDKVNKFTSVDYKSGSGSRNRDFDDEVFKGPIRQDLQDDRTKKMNFGQLVGTSSASWYSPGAQGIMKPYANICCLRLADDSGDLSAVSRSWFSQLCGPRMLIRKSGSTDPWMFTLSHIKCVVVALWPSVYDDRDGCWVPRNTPASQVQYQSVLDPNEWEAIPVTPISPTHRAILRELPPKTPFGSTVTLRQASNYGKLTIAAYPLGIPRSMLETACRCGFWELSLTFLISVCHYFDIATPDKRMFPVMKLLIGFLITPKEWSTELEVEILSLKGITLEPDEDVLALTESEFTLDVFSSDELEELEQEVQKAKSRVDAHREYTKSLREYKVTLKPKSWPPRVGSALHPLKTYSFHKEAAFGINDVPQSTARQFLPPDCFIWRSNDRGGWFVVYHPHRSHYESWSKYGGDSTRALLASLKFIWRQWLEDACLDESHCPISGIF